MSYRGESWEQIVARAASSAPAPRSIVEREDPAELAARAEAWTFKDPRFQVLGSKIVLGAHMESVELAYAQIYHVEPVDPWPSLAIGWVDQGHPYRAFFSAIGSADVFAAKVEALVDACLENVPTATHRGWLDVPERPWERVDALPTEREQGPMMRGYRMAPEVPEPIVAHRVIAPGLPRLLANVLARLRRIPHRVEPLEVVLTREHVYARSREGARLRVPVGALRAARRTSFGDAVYVFGRNTELLLVSQDDELAAHLDARAP